MHVDICAVCLGRPDTTPAGVELTLWKFSKELSRLGSNVHIVFDNSPCLDSFETVVDGVFLHGIGRSTNSFSGRLNFPIEGGQRLKEIEKVFKIDVFAFHGAAALGPLFFFKKNSSKPLIYHTYAALPFEARTHLFNLLQIKDISGFFSKTLMYSWYTPIEYVGLHCTQKLVLPHDIAMNEFKRYYGYPPHDKISIAPLGQDLRERYGRSIRHRDHEKRMLLFVGNDWRRKGVWHLILALNLVVNKQPNTVLVITGPLQEPFVSLVKKLKLEPYVRFVGNVSEQTLAEYYASCDIFVLPSFHEGFSNTLLEVMAFGKPVVTTPVAGYPVVSNGVEGFIVQPGDHNSLARAIISLLDDKELYDLMSKSALVKAELYNWKNVAKILLQIYENIKKEYDHR